MKPFWRQVNESQLAQGDLLDNCLVPHFEPEFGTNASAEVPLKTFRLIIATQSCDLVNDKVSLVALCTIFTLEEFEAANPQFKGKGRWEEVRKGRVEGLHLLASPQTPDNNRQALVTDFGQMFSLPPAYVRRHAESLGERWRLDSPFLEHFSQAFARYFMRVGLPSTIPHYR
jgi:hypothetical protein